MAQFDKHMQAADTHSVALLLGISTPCILHCNGRNPIHAAYPYRVKTLIKAQLGSSGDAAFVVAAYHKRWVYTLGRTTIKPGKNARILDKVVLGWFYKMLADNSK